MWTDHSTHDHKLPVHFLHQLVCCINMHESLLTRQFPFLYLYEQNVANVLIPIGNNNAVLYQLFIIFCIIISTSVKGKFHDQFFRRKAQNLRAEKGLGMRIENLIFAAKKILSARELNFFQLTGEIKKRNQSNSSIFIKKMLTSLFLHFSKSKQEMEIQNTLFVVECNLAKKLRRAKIARVKFSIKNMSWNLPFMLLCLQIHLFVYCFLYE